MNTENLKEKLNTLWTNVLLPFLTEVRLFFTSRIFLKNLLLLVGILLIILFLTFRWMKCYTRHGQSLQVHKYEGMKFDEARKLARSRNLRLVITDSAYVPNSPPNIILSQNPNPFTNVKKNRAIYVVVTLKEKPMVNLPKLDGGKDYYDNYIKILRAKHLGYEIIGRQFNNILSENTILEVWYDGENITRKVNSEQGYQVPAEDTLQFVVSTRRGGTIQVPQLVCQQLDAARFLLQGYDLEVGAVIEDATVYDPATAFVYKQQPGYYDGNMIAIGATVDLYVTQERPQNCD